jgi:hypothetical protein
MDEQLQEDWLDAKLRDEAPYIDDNGFTALVVSKLPAQRQSKSVRAAILFAITFVACAVAYFASGGGQFVGDSAAFLVAMPISTVCLLAICCGLLVTVLGTAAAVSKAGYPRR